MRIKIENLKLRTVVGIFEWEKEVKQDVVINIELNFDDNSAAESDKIEDTVDYKNLTKKVINFVENNSFNLIEKIAGGVGKIVMEDSRIAGAVIKVDKPGALRYADSVSVTFETER